MNPAGNTPQGLFDKGEELTFATVPAPNVDHGDYTDLQVWKKFLGTAVSEFASEFGLSHNSVEPRDDTVDLLGSVPASDWLLI